MKKRYILLILIAMMIAFGSVIAYTKPVLPFIQLPGEPYPGTEGMMPAFLFNNAGLLNTFVAALVAWVGTMRWPASSNSSPVNR